MSLGIAFKGPEGLVLAADSRVTLNAEMSQGDRTMIIPATYDNATKLLRIPGQDYVGAVTYGVGALGQTEPRTAHSFTPEFSEELNEALKDEENKRLSVKEFSGRLGRFFKRQWNELMPENYTGPDMVFLVGGYNEGEAYGRVYRFGIPSSAEPVEQNAGEGVFGISWGGQLEFTSRLINGYDPKIPHFLQHKFGISDEQRIELDNELKSNFTTNIPYQFLPLQDCIDLSIFLIRTTAEIQSRLVGVRGVGGHIDVARITRIEGFKPVQQKHIHGDSD